MNKPEFSKKLQNIEVLSYETVGSTNDEAKRKAEVTVTSDLLITADTQTAGKGRMGRSFYSPQNTGVYMSYAFLSDVNEDVLTSTAAAAVAVCEALEELTPLTPKIKWVNDIYVDGKKVCGILAESVAVGNKRCFIIGIGINLTTSVFPDEIKDKAGSVNFDIDKVSLITLIVRKLQNYKAVGFKTSLDAYRKRSAVIGKKIAFTENGITKEGIAKSITESGALEVACDGKTVLLSTGEISVSLKI